jgi:hypothetical protein
MESKARGTGQTRVRGVCEGDTGEGSSGFAGGQRGGRIVPPPVSSADVKNLGGGRLVRERVRESE